MGRLSSIIWMDPNAITSVPLREVEGDVTFAGEAVTCEVTHTGWARAQGVHSQQKLAGRRKEFSPRSLRRDRALPTPPCQPTDTAFRRPASRADRINVCALSHQICGECLQRLQETHPRTF